jgi:Protein of unknown function (DUF1553)/Protein of unknown function (DUF1549)/Planctomycete cytochrome C
MHFTGTVNANPTMHAFLRLAVAILAVFWLPFSLIAQDLDFADEEKLRHFESKIRPVLIKYCHECHATETERSGGLLLDSAPGWHQGGESGATIQAGNAESSLLMQAIRYDNPDLQMPPDGKLPVEVIEDFRVWIEQGAFDPRQNPQASKQDRSPTRWVEEAQTHWAYQPIRRSLQKQFESTSGGTDTRQTLQAQPSVHNVDRFIDAKLDGTGIQVAPLASPIALVRRLYFDLTGLPPTVQQLAYWSENMTDERYAELIEHLLASPHYGETFARHWMDVVRYGDSVALRGFIHKNAWRYRDYLVEAYNQDRSFQQLIREQVAGDLLPFSDDATRSRQIVATAFLALGNTNLEKQDKHQLDMDYLDEQLDVIGAAFLGQTIGCARCHDHKFDPIPTRDYYALAGILKSASGMKHDNVSEWIELPLPMDRLLQEEFDQIESQHAQLTKKAQQLKTQLDAIASANPRFIDPQELPGIVVDSDQATLVGSWVASSSVGNIVGSTYLHDGNTDKGLKSATFEPASLLPGEYDVLLAYQSADNRATNVIVKVFSADGDKEIPVNQRLSAPELNLWFHLGRFRFEANGQKYVLVSNSDTDGHVILDAVLFLPADEMQDRSLTATLQPGRSPDETTSKTDELTRELKQLEEQLAAAQKKLDSRPRYLTVVETGKAQDIAICIRGDVHTLGEVVPRGFLTALKLPTDGMDPPDRRQLAYWLSHDDNPLTARVYANRIWSWLMGGGIVMTPNNFGTTGSPPTHPELLEWLSDRLIASGWSTKAIVRDIVLSKAYRRAIVEPCSVASTKDPDNRLLWRGQLRRLNVESLRDAMLLISGELDETQGGSLIRPGTNEDYNYVHNSTRRSIYQPVFRNSLAELFDEFDFANPSTSIDLRSRSTVAPQGLALMQDRWITARAKQTALKYASIIRSEGEAAGIEQLFLACLGRQPTAGERQICYDFLAQAGQADHRDPQDSAQPRIDEARLEQLAQALFSSIDFRFLD